jgi:phospholipid/cholesterol/gamma-HCH transport system permease protein
MEMIGVVEAVGARALFGLEILKSFPSWRKFILPIINQMYIVGVKSVLTTMASGLFVGSILAIQINMQLRDFGAQAFLGGLSASVTIRNVGPVLIAFILSGKVGAYTAAELGTMQVTDQLNAIRCLGMSPIQYLVAPRLVAVTISSFLLLVIGIMCAIGGGVLISSLHLGVNSLNYIQQMPEIVKPGSVALGLVKSFVFGLAIGLISCFHGYYAEGGAAGVGRTVRRTSVETLVTIIVLDFALSMFATQLGSLVP